MKYTESEYFLESLGFLKGQEIHSSSDIQKQSGWLAELYKEYSNRRIDESLRFIDYCDILNDGLLLELIQSRAGQYKLKYSRYIENCVKVLKDWIEYLKERGNNTENKRERLSLGYQAVYIKYKINKLRDIINLQERDIVTRYFQSDMISELSQLYKIDNTFSQVYYLAALICMADSEKLLYSIEYLNNFIDGLGQSREEFSSIGLYLIGKYCIYIINDKDTGIRYLKSCLELIDKYKIQSSLKSLAYLELARTSRNLNDRKVYLERQKNEIDKHKINNENLRDILVRYKTYIMLSDITKFNGEYVDKCIEYTHCIEQLVNGLKCCVLQYRMLWYCIKVVLHNDIFNKDLSNYVQNQLDRGDITENE